VKLQTFEYSAKVEKVKLIYYRLSTCMQSELFQAFICYNFNYYGLQVMKTPNSILEYCEKIFIAVSHNQNYNK